LRKVIIGIGNDFQGDDAVGRIIARKIERLHLPNVDVLERSGEAAELIDAWKGEDSVVLIDAMVSGAEPGTLKRFDVSDKPLPRTLFQHVSSHTFSVAESIELARALNALPNNIVVYGVEAVRFEAGDALSTGIDIALDDIVKQILLEL
jgi:hydrogenase maturation protease